MTGQKLDKLVRLEVAPDQMSATLYLEPGIADGVLTEAALLDLAQASGVQVTPDVAARARAILAAYNPESPNPARGTLAWGTPPAHGIDGRFEWETRLDPKLDPAIERDADGGVDHYRRSTIRVVGAGERLGRVVAPTTGVDGCDVAGRSLAAKDGKPAALREDDTICIHGDGQVTALATGAIEQAAGTIRVSGEVRIAGAVDFSTGHIDFRGDVEIGDGVRDCFEVRAERTITIRGLVGSAHLEAGRDVILQGGMAGRERGTLRAGRDAQAKYLDATHVDVGRDLQVDRETVNCTISVGRTFNSENGVLAGGVLIVGDACVIGQLGSEAGVETVVVLGRIEELERLDVMARQIMPTLISQARRAEEKASQLRSVAGRDSDRHADEVTSLQFAAEAARAKLVPLEQASARLRGVIEAHSRVDLLVRKRLNPGVKLYIGTLVALINDPLKGPLRITRDGEQNLVIRDEKAGSTVPLHRHARILEHHAYTGPLASRAA